ncbi:DUF6266 family protein [Pedobacter aquatilis]|uniref:DUF6266 family protein n=1 Tax=Pedobacter aquatilis TaxID=351343 RepID=UPI00292E0B64|nr:DUF6266 family protein [Pedobacter aquatilis]
MAILKNGLFGGFTGKVGNIVGYKRKGKFYIKAAPRPRKNAPTPMQLIQREKFALANQFLKMIRPLVRIGFGGDDETRHKWWAIAVANCLKNVVQDSSSALEIDYENICFSKGKLGKPIVKNIQPVEGQHLTLNWFVDDSYEDCRPDEQLVLLICNPEMGQAMYNLDVAKRIDGQAAFSLPLHFKDTEVYVHAAFFAVDESAVSDSTFIGLIKII